MNSSVEKSGRLYPFHLADKRRQVERTGRTGIVPKAAERSTFVLLASLALLLLIRFWQPMLAPVWTVENLLARTVLQALFWAGWAVVFTSTFLIDHFELFA